MQPEPNHMPNRKPHSRLIPQIHSASIPSFVPNNNLAEVPPQLQSCPSNPMPTPHPKPNIAPLVVKDNPDTNSTSNKTPAALCDVSSTGFITLNEDVKPSVENQIVTESSVNEKNKDEDRVSREKTKGIKLKKKKLMTVIDIFIGCSSQICDLVSRTLFHHVAYFGDFQYRKKKQIHIY